MPARTILFLLILSQPGAVAADVVSQDLACPRGTRTRNTHEGFRCLPSPCDPATPCPYGGTCQPWRVCTREARVEPAGLRPPQNEPWTEEIVVETCAPDAACDGDVDRPPPSVGDFIGGAPSCTVASYCVRETEALPPFPGASAEPPDAGESGCGCHAVASSRIPAAGVVTLALALLLFRRRR